MSELIELRNDILSEMYRHATPPLDFSMVLQDPTKMDEQWYKDHHLPAKKQEEIFEKHISDTSLTTQEETSLRMDIFLGAAPNTAAP